MLRATVRGTLARRRLIEPGHRILLGCSGGPDSVAMVHVMHSLRRECGLDLSVASVDHGLRVESAAEVREVGALAHRLSLPFFPLRIVVPPGASLQANARKARYGALLDLAQERGFHRIAVGHTRDDQAETVLDRFLRGPSIRGLGGIEPLREDGVVRPLIDVRRAEVLAYLDHHGLTPVLDPSNADPRFRRPRLRHGILPMLERENPALVDHLAHLAEDARPPARFLRDTAQRAATEAPIALTAPRLPRRALDPLPPPIRREVLSLWLRQGMNGAPTRSHLGDVESMAEWGHVLLGGGISIRFE
ncbi:MAG: tRNA lysidine(34) synthetase TilS, partial [Myxococcales bacterium]|nr:tRNA lysidine(34) synthetase TilS [Myxococcales bacterium]